MDVTILWDLEDDEQGNVQHIAEHGFDKDDVALIFDNPVGLDHSDSSGQPAVFGYTVDGRYVAVVFEQVDDETVYPITAYEVPEPR